ncbi:hypothetical protein HET69_41690, partial [Streptomyces sp. CJ_13]|nr:hypothetical protein [Streptomyces sp. CJ_13]
PFHGLLALPVPRDGAPLSCAFTPKGLAPGLAAATLALLALAAVTLTPRLRRRRAGRRG